MSRRLRLLLIVSSARTGGGEGTFRHLVEYLNLDRFDLCVVSPPWPVVERLAVERGFQFVPLTLPSSIDWGTIRQVARLIKQQQPDILHSHLLMSDLYVAAASQIVRPPVMVSTVQGLNYLWWLERFPRRQRYWLLARLYRAVYACFDEVVTCSAALRKAICTGPGARVNPGKTRVIYNSIDVQKVRTRAQGMIASPRGSERQIVTVANFAPVKGHAVLLHALVHLGSDPRVRCLLVGDGPLRSSMEQLARDLGVTDRVEFLGAREDVAAIVRSADLFVLPSLWEGLGIAILEAMALEVPVVACDAGGVPEVVRDGETGILVAAGDPVALANGVRRGLEDTELRRRIVSKAFAQVQAKFDVSQMVTAYEQWYQDLAVSTHR